MRSSEHILVPLTHRFIIATSKAVSTALQLLLGDVKRAIFLEPSCGDGRLLLELLNSIREQNKLQIVGYDIDPSAIERSQRQLEGRSVVLKCNNFLTLTRDELLMDVLQEVEESPRKRSRSDDSACDNVYSSLVVFGGPPYTPKSLPKQFILHSITELRAEVVVFILPKRCSNEAESIQNELNNNTSDGERWCYTNKELANSLFSFQETIVTQPSILQSWYRINT